MILPATYLTVWADGSITITQCIADKKVLKMKLSEELGGDIAASFAHTYELPEGHSVQTNLNDRRADDPIEIKILRPDGKLVNVGELTEIDFNP